MRNARAAEREREREREEILRQQQLLGQAAVPKSAGPPPMNKVMQRQQMVDVKKKNLTTIPLTLETGPGGRRVSQEDADEDEMDEDEEELLHFQRKRALRIRYDHALDPSKSSSSDSEREAAAKGAGSKSGSDDAAKQQPIRCFLPEQIKPSMGVSVRCDLISDRPGSLSRALLRVAPDS